MNQTAIDEIEAKINALQSRMGNANAELRQTLELQLTHLVAMLDSVRNGGAATLAAVSAILADDKTR